MNKWGWNPGKKDTVGGEVKKAAFCTGSEAGEGLCRREGKEHSGEEGAGDPCRAQGQEGDKWWEIWLTSWKGSIPFWTQWERRDSRKHNGLHLKSTGKSIRSSSTCWLPSPSFIFPSSPFTLFRTGEVPNISYITYTKKAEKTQKLSAGETVCPAGICN